MSVVSVRPRGRPRDRALAERRRAEILDVAVRMFADRGFALTDLQDVADALGVGKGTIYRYFSKKSDLFLAAVDRGIRQLSQSVDAAIEGLSDPLDRVLQAVTTYLAFFDAHPGLVELFIQERAAFKDRRKPSYFQNREARVVRWNDMYRGLIADGRVRGMPAEQITDFIGDLLYGAMFTNYFAGRRRNPETQARQLVDMIFNGILTERERARWRAVSSKGGRT